MTTQAKSGMAVRFGKQAHGHPVYEENELTVTLTLEAHEMVRLLGDARQSMVNYRNYVRDVEHDADDAQKTEDKMADLLALMRRITLKAKALDSKQDTEIYKYLDILTEYK